MAFFTSLTASIIDKAVETTNSEDQEIYEIKAICQASPDAMPVLLQVFRDTSTGKFLKEAADMAAAGKSMRLQVTGIVQTVQAEKNDETQKITKKSKLIVFVGAARRVQSDRKKDPEQAIVFGSGFVTPQHKDRHRTERKPELYISCGTQSLTDTGEYCEGFRLRGDRAYQTDETCLNMEEDREVYFMGDLHRRSGNFEREVNGKMMDTEWDNITAVVSFLQETDRVREKRSTGKPRPISMTAQLADSFDEPDSDDSVMSSDDLCKQASVSLADF